MVEIFLNTNLVIYNKLHTRINKASKLTGVFSVTWHIPVSWQRYRRAHTTAWQLSCCGIQRQLNKGNFFFFFPQCNIVFLLFKWAIEHSWENRLYIKYIGINCDGYPCPTRRESCYSAWNGNEIERPRSVIQPKETLKFCSTFSPHHMSLY